MRSIAVSMDPADESEKAMPVAQIQPQVQPRIVTLRDVGRGRSSVIRMLGDRGTVVEEVADVPGILARLDRPPVPDLVVIGWEMQGIAGTEMLQQLRGLGTEFSVLVLGGAAAASDETMIGADGSLPNLARLLEVVVANASGGEPGAALVVAGTERSGVIELNLEACRAYWNRQRVDLSLTEFRVVSRMAATPGIDFSHRDIYDLIKGEGVVSGRGEAGYRGNVRAAIKRIRRKFTRLDQSFSAIRSYHGFGYRWEESQATEIVGRRSGDTGGTMDAAAPGPAPPGGDGPSADG
ncbi:MAG: response regulator transcription factor [Acetobacteraceae bacterium]